MLKSLKRFSGSSLCAIAVNYHPVIGNELLTAQSEANQFHSFEGIAGNGLELVFRSEDPTWTLQVGPQRSFAFFLTAEQPLDNSFRREFGNLLFRVTEKLGIESVTRVGFATLAFIPMMDIEFSDLGMSVATHALRSTLYEELGISRIDPLIKLDGYIEQHDVNTATTIAPMNRKQATETMRNSPIWQSVSQRKMHTSGAVCDFANNIADVNFFIDTDVFVSDVAAKDLRKTIDKLLSGIDHQFSVLSQMFALTK